MYKDKTIASLTHNANKTPEMGVYLYIKQNKKRSYCPRTQGYVQATELQACRSVHVTSVHAVQYAVQVCTSATKIVVTLLSTLYQNGSSTASGKQQSTDPDQVTAIHLT